MVRFSTLLITVFGLVISLDVSAKCQVLDSIGKPTSKKADPLFAILSDGDGCPSDVRQLKNQLFKVGATIEPAMVGNRGFHNPDLGSFSFFETVTGNVLGQLVKPGDFFFGHFTTVEDGKLTLDQSSEKGKLMIELIVWDSQKEMFNFYELIGNHQGSTWFYRGDSGDALLDNKYVHLSPSEGEKKFGSRMRCSACHSSGGPIMKELKLPHNDWWTNQRPLPIAQMPDDEVKGWLTKLIDANDFSKSVIAGIQKLEQSQSYQKARAQLSIAEQLRPLFCENEINLESDIVPLDGTLSKVNIPNASIVSPYFAVATVTVKKSEYLNLLSTYGLKFPEINRRDADHAWLTPVKGYSDLLAIKTLIARGVVTSEFAADVLAVNMKNPVLSKARCELLKLVPSDSGNWQAQFLETLKATDLESAKELLRYLIDPLETAAAHKVKAQRLLETTDVALSFAQLLKDRESVFGDEISQNPRGQILEPGFRVIFPEPQH